MSPYTPPCSHIEDASEVEQIFNPNTRPEDALEFRGSVGTVTFSGHLYEHGSGVGEVDEIEVEAFGWCLEIRRSERGIVTYDSRLRIARINPVINFESVPICDCRFTLGEGHGRRIEGQGRLVNFGLGGQELEIEAHHFSIHSSYGIRRSTFDGSDFVGILPRPTFDGFAFGGDEPPEKPNKRAEALLLSVLDKEQQSQYKSERLFRYAEQAKQRLWRFRLKYHYPVQYLFSGQSIAGEFRGLCIDLDQETPTEDILLMCYLEVKGGRGDELIKAGLGGRPSVPQRCPPLGRRPSDPVPEPPRRPSAIVLDDVEARETCTHTVDHARPNTESMTRLFQAMIGVTDEERYAITRERLSHAIGNLRLNTERLTRSVEQATENLRILRRVFQQATVGGEQGVSCNPRMHDWIRENVSQANFVPEGQIDRFRYIGTLFGMDVIVDQHQREPIRVIDIT